MPSSAHIIHADLDASVEQRDDPSLRGKPLSIDAAVDPVRDRFGTTAMQRGVLVRAGDRIAPWLIPGLDGVEPE